MNHQFINIGVILATILTSCCLLTHTTKVCADTNTPVVPLSPIKGVMFKGASRDKQPPGAFLLDHSNKHLYWLTYTSLVKLDADQLNILNRCDIPDQPGHGFLALAISPNGERLAVYRMPDQVVIFDANTFQELYAVTLAISDYCTLLSWPDDAGPLFALGDKGWVGLVKEPGAKAKVETVRLEGSRPMNWTYSEDDHSHYITYGDTGTISRLGGSNGLVQSVIELPQFTSKVVSSGIFSFRVNLNGIAVDSKRRRLYVQSVGPLRPGPLRDIIVAVDLSGPKVIGEWEAWGGQLQLVRNGSYLLSRVVVGPERALQIAVIDTEVPRLKCRLKIDSDNFTVSQEGTQLFSLKCIGDDFKIERFDVPLSRGVSPEIEHRHANQ